MDGLVIGEDMKACGVNKNMVRIKRGGGKEYK